MPLRAIVSEKGSWQGVISREIQKHLNHICVDDPFRIRNSNELVEVLPELHKKGDNFAFSIDVEDLFYSIPKKELIDAVRTLIEENGPVRFQNASGMSTEGFIDLLAFYLESTFVAFNDQYYVQKEGVCIGSCIAPILCEVFLAVYRIPLSCGKCYVGQTGRCLNDRLREHRAAVSSLRQEAIWPIIAGGALICFP
ncbi:uncharacterized protein LOC144180093 [Haemaphysalis longicornis]